MIERLVHFSKRDHYRVDFLKIEGIGLKNNEVKVMNRIYVYRRIIGV
jgi:hypothetical protein